MKSKTFTINVKNGLYIGDLCYVVPESVFHGVWGKADFKDGNYTDPATGLEFAAVHTIYSDGMYFDYDGYGYPVDSGSIGICDIDLCTEDNPEEVGRVLPVTGKVTIFSDNGYIHVEPLSGKNIIIIDTNTINDDDDDYDASEEDEFNLNFDAPEE